MPRPEYHSINAPRKLIERLEAVILKHPEFGYKTPGAAAVEGIRRFLLELEERAAWGPEAEPSMIPAHLRRQFAEEMILVMQRYLQRKKENAKRDR